MGFVNELIPDAEKQAVRFPVHVEADGSKPTLWKWTIDRTREAYLVFTRSEGGGYEGTRVTRHFMLVWQGNLIEISADPLGVTDIASGSAMSWRLRMLRIPPYLREKRAEVVKLVEEAFSTMGDLYDGEQYVAVDVDFDHCSSRID